MPVTGRVGVLVILLACTLAGSCDGGKLFHALDPPDPLEYSLSGTVRDARTGAALTGAKLTCGDATTISGDWGDYRFTGLSRKEYTLTASREGYWNFQASVQFEFEDLRYDVEMQPR